MSNRRVDPVIDQVENKTLLNVQKQDLYIFDGGIFKLDKVNNDTKNVFCLFV